MKLKAWIYRLTGLYSKMGNKFCYETPRSQSLRKSNRRNKKTLSIFFSLDE